MLLIFGQAQAADEFQLIEDVVIDLAERRIGIEHIGILAEKIIVTLIVEARGRFGSM